MEIFENVRYNRNLFRIPTANDHPFKTFPIESILRRLSSSYSRSKPFRIQLTVSPLKRNRDVFTSILKEALNQVLLFLSSLENFSIKHS